MIDFTIQMEQELDDFYNERERHNNLKMLIDFEQSSIEYTSKKMNIEDSKPKLKKRLKASKFIPKSNKKSLF
jgi:uncharacterized membrane protein YjjP (DUF1212 family)